MYPADGFVLYHAAERNSLSKLFILETVIEQIRRSRSPAGKEITECECIQRVMPERTVKWDLFVSDNMKGSRSRIFLLISVWSPVKTFHVIMTDKPVRFCA